MEDAFDILAEDHEEIRQVLAELEKGPTAATGATEDQLMLRKMMTDELVIETAKHEDIELACLWPAVRERASGQLADRGICAELEMMELLGGLAKLDAGEPGFEELLGRFTAAARSHFDFEERQAWPRLRAALTPKASAALGRKILLGKQPGLVLPHPRASASPGGNAHRGLLG